MTFWLMIRLLAVVAVRFLCIPAAAEENGIQEEMPVAILDVVETATELASPARGASEGPRGSVAIQPGAAGLQLSIGVFVCFLFGWATTAVSELIVHRYIYHGRWKWVREPRGSHRRLCTWFHCGYLHHLRVHHDDSRRDQEHLLKYGEPSSERKQLHLARYPRFIFTLKRSNFGMSGTVAGALHHYSMLAATPLPYVFLVLLAFSPLHAVAFLAPSVLFPISSAGYHPLLHMNEPARRRATPWYYRPLISSREGARLVISHYLHHYGKADCNYNIIPFSGWLGRLLGLDVALDSTTATEMARLQLLSAEALRRHVGREASDHRCHRQMGDLDD